MIDCLKDTIGVRGCGSAVPASGLYINELPGITLESIDKMVEAEQQTWKQLWSDVQDRAILRISNLNFSEIKRCYQIKTKDCADDLLCDNAEQYYTCYWYLLGEELMNVRLFSTRWNKWTISKETARELKDHCNEQFKIEIQIAVETLTIDTSGECFSAGGGQVQFVTILP